MLLQFLGEIISYVAKIIVYLYKPSGYLIFGNLCQDIVLIVSRSLRKDYYLNYNIKKMILEHDIIRCSLSGVTSNAVEFIGMKGDFGME